MPLTLACCFDFPVQLEQDVKESIFSMAIQSGRLDTNVSVVF